MAPPARCLQVFSGLLLGAMLPYWFSAMTMKSVGKAALAMVQEVRRQFNTIAGERRGKGGAGRERQEAAAGGSGGDEKQARALFHMRPLGHGVGRGCPLQNRQPLDDLNPAVP